MESGQTHLNLTIFQASLRDAASLSLEIQWTEVHGYRQ
jgi:hypothetical protein